MDKLGFLKEFERRCDVLLDSAMEFNEKCMIKRDSLIRLGKAAVKLKVMTQTQLKRLVGQLDDALLFNELNPQLASPIRPYQVRQNAVRQAKNLPTASKIRSYNHSMEMDKRWSH